MKINKLISVFLAVVVAILAITFSVSAKSPVLIQEETVLFDEDFKNVSSAADLSDFDVSDGWEYFEGYMGQMNNSGIGNISESIMTKESFDMSDAASWQYTTKLYLWKNYYNIFMGWDEANNKGYKLKWDYSTKTLSLYQAGNETALAEGTLTTSGHTTYTITYKDGKITVDTSIYTGGQTYNQDDLIAYTVSTSDFDGKFGVECSNAAEIILYTLKLEKGIGENINHWTYEEDFEGETLDSLAEKGWTLGSDAKMRNEDEAESNMKTGENDFLFTEKAFSFMPNNSSLSGSIGINAETYSGYNGHHSYIAFRGTDNNEYRIYQSLNKTHCAIVKCSKSTSTITDDMILDKLDQTGVNYNQVNWDIKVVQSETGVDITANLTIGDANKTGTLYTLKATDESNVIEPANVIINLGSTGQSWLYDFSLYSIPDQADRTPVSYDKVVIDKKFSADDSYGRIIADGFHRFADKTQNNNNLNLYARFLDSVGMDYDSEFYYTMENSGKDYTLEIDAYREYNTSKVRFCGTSNGASSNASLSSYYELEAGNYNVTLRKKTADATIQLDAKTSIGWDNSGMVNFSNYKINCDYNDDGSLDITAEYKGAKGTTQVLTYKDTEPLTGNLTYMHVGDKGSVQRFRITEPASEIDVNGDMPLFNPRFYNGEGEAVTKIQSGAIYAKTFAMPLIDMVITAVLYDNGDVVDVKNIMPIQIASENGVKLFDVPETGKPEIRLFIFDNGKSLNKVIETLELR